MQATRFWNAGLLRRIFLNFGSSGFLLRLPRYTIRVLQYVVNRAGSALFAFSVCFIVLSVARTLSDTKIGGTRWKGEEESLSDVAVSAALPVLSSRGTFFIGPPPYLAFLSALTRSSFSRAFALARSSSSFSRLRSSMRRLRSASSSCARCLVISLPMSMRIRSRSRSDLRSSSSRFTLACSSMIFSCSFASSGESFFLGCRLFLGTLGSGSSMSASFSCSSIHPIAVSIVVPPDRTTARRDLFSLNPISFRSFSNSSLQGGSTSSSPSSSSAPASCISESVGASSAFDPAGCEVDSSCPAAIDDGCSGADSIASRRTSSSARTT
mmetsp:Transcript_8004/g.29595  ORF Transcript_8004/g.29595 Transcript_8004/m.29595 type:complete len:325 (-) Transcript_8004:66-1040(-)